VAEPEGLLIEGARRAAVAARELWWRARPAPDRAELPLSRVRRRLELFTGALYPGSPDILPADPPPPPTWLARATGQAPRHLVRRAASAGSDGAVLWLPRTLAVTSDEAGATAAYRILALEQAARASRGTPARVPRDPLERDLYALAEAVAVDHELAISFPGLALPLRAARAEALRERPAVGRLTGLERQVERLIVGVLSADPAAPPPSVPLVATPVESLAWARATAARWRRPRDRYRGVPVVAPWGLVLPAAPGTAPGLSSGAPSRADERPRPKAVSLRQRPRARRAADDEDDARTGTWMIRADDPMESVEDPMGLQRPADHDADADAADLADSLSELPEARVVTTPDAPREVLHGDADPVARVPARPGSASGTGIVYPEWDYRLGAYRQHGVVVWPRVAPAGPARWVDEVLARHASLVRRVRRRFERLRPRRRRVDRQDDGPDLDVAAYVSSFADWRAGLAGDDRFYVAARPGHRDLAIALLVDVSASTDGWIGGSLRVVDVEKESLVVLLEALDALGDRHAAFAFSTDGPALVRVLTIKDFAEPTGPQVRRRVAALEPDGSTRLGAAVRHVSATLAREPARHRLLLVLSDGKPNDVDEYQGHYGVEDTRQAVAEARVQGLVPFCLTVDHEAPRYMPAIFGCRGYALLRRQESLPAVLVEVVRRLLLP
jgi:nitric oxide reductase NorD protein